MKSLYGERYRLWCYTEEVAKKLEEEGFSPGFYGYTISDWLEDIEKLITERGKGIEDLLPKDEVLYIVRLSMVRLLDLIEKEIKGLDT